MSAGEALGADELTELAAAHDILSLGMLADAMRRRLHGTRVTYLRVADCALDRSFVDAVSPAAAEIRITALPETLDAGRQCREAARAVAGDRTVCRVFVGRRRAPGVEAAATCAITCSRALRAAGLDALADDATGHGCRRRRQLSRSSRAPGFSSCV